MDAKWVKVYETGDVYRAEIYKGGLEANDIEVVLINKKDSAYLFGMIELYVKSEDVIKSLRLIKSLEEN